MDPNQLLNDAIARVVGGMMFGEEVDTDMEKFKTFVENHDHIIQRTAKAMILDFLPFLQYLPVGKYLYSGVVKLHYKNASFVRHMIDRKRMPTLVEGEARDLLEAYLKRDDQNGYIDNHSGMYNVNKHMKLLLHILVRDTVWKLFSENN